MRLAITVFVLVVLGFCRADMPIPPITWCQYSFDQFFWDLNGLRLSTDAYPYGYRILNSTDDEHPDDHYNYYVNMCGYVKHGCHDVHNETVVQSKVVPVGGVADCRSCAMHSAQTKFQVIDKLDPAVGLTMRIYHGDTYHRAPCANKHRQTVIRLLCSCVAPTDYDNVQLTFIGEPADACEYTFELVHKLACPVGICDNTGSSVHHHHSSKISGGWIFIIILSSISLIYFCGGLIYKKTVLHTEGLESCPNVDLWREFFGLVGAGCSYVGKGCKNEKSYATFDGEEGESREPATSGQYGSISQ